MFSTFDAVQIIFTYFWPYYFFFHQCCFCCLINFILFRLTSLKQDVLIVKESAKNILCTKLLNTKKAKILYGLKVNIFYLRYYVINLYFMPETLWFNFFPPPQCAIFNSSRLSLKFYKYKYVARLKPKTVFLLFVLLTPFPLILLTFQEKTYLVSPLPPNFNHSRARKILDDQSGMWAVKKKKKKKMPK